MLSAWAETASPLGLRFAPPEGAMVAKLCIRIGALLAVPAFVVACSGGDGTKVGGDRQTALPETIVPSDAGARAANADDDAGSWEILGDPQIVGVLETYDDAELREARLVPTRAIDGRVKAYAERVVTEHTASQATLARYERAESVSPRPSATRAQIEAAAEEQIATMAPMNGHTFDVSYMQSQVEAHYALLTVIDQTLTPCSSDRQLRSLVQTVRASVAEHLAEAQALAMDVVANGPWVAEGDAAADGRVAAADASTY
jgi:putative membrane protein